MIEKHIYVEEVKLLLVSVDAAKFQDWKKPQFGSVINSLISRWDREEHPVECVLYNWATTETRINYYVVTDATNQQLPSRLIHFADTKWFKHLKSLMSNVTVRGPKGEQHLIVDDSMDLVMHKMLFTENARVFGDD